MAMVLATVLALACSEPVRLPADRSEPLDGTGDEPPSERPLIAYYADTEDGERLIIAGVDGVVRRAYELPWVTVRDGGPCWLADGTGIVVWPNATQDQGLFVLDIERGEISSLAQVPGWYLRSPSGSRRGDLAFIGNSIAESGELEPSEVFTHVATAAERLTENATPDFSPAWSDAGDLAFVQNQPGPFSPGASRIAIVRADGTRAVHPVDVSFVTRLAWAPGGAQIAFLGGPVGAEGLYLMPASGGAPELLARLDATWLQWSSDGRFLALHTGGLSHWLYRYDLAERALVEMTRADMPDWPAISPDGQWILLRSMRGGSRNVLMMRWDGSEERLLTHYEWPLSAGASEWQGFCR